MYTQKASARLDGDSSLYECLIVHDGKEPMSLADAESLLTQAVTAPGEQETVQVEAITDHADDVEHRTPDNEMADRRDILTHCLAITETGLSREFVGIANMQSHRFAVISARTVDELGYLMGDLLIKALPPDASQAVVQAMVRLVAHHAAEQRT